MKWIKIILTIISVVLLIGLIIHTSKLYESSTKLNEINKETISYNNKINDIDNNQELLNIELKKLKNKNKAKLKELNRWQDWIKEIKEKME